MTFDRKKYFSDPIVREKRRLYCKKYYRKNREAFQLYFKKYYRKHKEKVILAAKKWCEANPEKYLEASRRANAKYRANLSPEKKEKLRVMKQKWWIKWRQEHPKEYIQQLAASRKRHKLRKGGGEQHAG